MDALEKLKDVINDDIYNEIEGALEEKDSRISELESEKEDLEYDVSSNESQISTLECEKEENESELFELKHKLNYYIDDYIEENYSEYLLILKSEHNKLKEEHEEYRKGWVKWSDNQYDYKRLKNWKDWDDISDLNIKNPPSDIGQNCKDCNGEDDSVTYWVNYGKPWGYTHGSSNFPEYENQDIHGCRYVYRASRTVSEVDNDDPWDLLEQNDPDFKRIGYLKVRDYPVTKKQTKELVYFKDLLKKYFNLLKK